MTVLKTRKTGADVKAFLDQIEDKQRRKDCKTLVRLMKKITASEPRLWSHGAIGFGDYAYKRRSGQSGNWYLTGFAPRKQAISIMLMAGLSRHKELLKDLGKHKTGVGCLYVQSLADIDLEVLEALIRANIQELEAIRKKK